MFTSHHESKVEVIRKRFNYKLRSSSNSSTFIHRRVPIFCHAEKSRLWPKLQRSTSHETFKSQFCSSCWNERRLTRLFQSHLNDFGLFDNFPIFYYSLLRLRWCRHVRGEGKICVRFRSHCASRSIEDLATRSRRVILYSSGPRLFWGRAWGAQYGYASSAPQRSLLAAQL